MHFTRSLFTFASTTFYGHSNAPDVFQSEGIAYFVKMCLFCVGRVFKERLVRRVKRTLHCTDTADKLYNEPYVVQVMKARWLRRLG